MRSNKLLIKIFIGVFIALLLFPNTGLPRTAENTAIVKKENRNITAFPKQSPKVKAFYTNFEKWYQDRLRYRDKAISAWASLNFAAGVMIKDHIFLGRNDWLFSKNNCIKNFNDPQIKIANLKKLQEYCLKHGKNFIFMVAPSKEAIYRDYFFARDIRRYKDYSEWEAQATALFKDNGINHLSVTNALLEKRKASNEDLYFPDDHHWSYYGSSIAADLLLRKIQQSSEKIFYKGLTLDSIRENAYKEHSYANAIKIPYSTKTTAPWSKKFQDSIVVRDCYTGKETKLNKILSNDILWGKIVNGEAIIKNKASHNGVTLLVLGDSYSSYMMPYLSQKAEKIIFTHYRDKAGKKKNTDLRRLMTEHNPDAVILEMMCNAFFHPQKNDAFKNIIM